MEKLIETINNRCKQFEYPSLNSRYVEYIEKLNKICKSPYNNIPKSFYHIFEALLLTTVAGVDEFDRIADLCKICEPFFTKYQEDGLIDIDFYGSYFDNLYAVNYDSDSYSKIELAKIKKQLKHQNQQLMDKIFKGCGSNKPIEAIKELFDIDPNLDRLYIVCFDFFPLATQAYEAYEEERQYDKKMKNMGYFIPRKNRKSELNSTRKGILSDIASMLSFILSYYSSLNNDIQRENGRINRIKRNYLSLINNLKKCENSYISNIEKDILLIEDEEVLREYLFYVARHNAKFHEEVQRENDNLREKQISNIELLFSKYNYNISDIKEDDLLKLQQADNLEEKLAFLSRSSLKYLNPSHCLFVGFISNMSIDYIKLFEYLSEKGIIDEQFLLQHSEIVNEKRKLINFKANFDFLQDKYILEISKYSKDIFAIDNDKLFSRYNLMKEKYKIPFENMHIFDFLLDDEVFDLLDNFIELGYYNVIKNNPNYLTMKNKIMIKRLQVAKLIGMDAVTSDNSFVGSIVSGKDFYVSDNDLDKLIYSEVDTSLDIDGSRLSINISDIEDFEALLEFENDELTYKIENCLISKNRMLRNLHALKRNDNKDLLLATLYKSINLTDESLTKIKEILGGKKLVKKMD